MAERRIDYVRNESRSENYCTNVERILPSFMGKEDWDQRMICLHELLRKSP